MALRLNHLFQNAPQQVMERTVIFVDKLNGPEMRNKVAHFIDLEMVGKHAHARVLAGLHQYRQDSPLVSYFVVPGGVTHVPRQDSPHSFIFLPDFTRCRLLVSAAGEQGLRFQLEENLMGSLPAPGPSVLDSFAYWDYTHGPLLGLVRGTAVLYRPPGGPWTAIMQQIVGVAGDELVKQVFTRTLNLQPSETRE